MRAIEGEIIQLHLRMRYCIGSLYYENRHQAFHYCYYFDSKTSAITPAARGVEALVPVNEVVHLFLTEVETYTKAQ